MKKITISLLMLLTAVMGTEAKNWKIGPSSVTGMDFASINDAMSSSDVAAGDTLYLNQYYSTSAEQTVTKAVVIIGTGYDTSLTDEKVVATLNSALHLKADNVVVKSVRLSYVYFYNDNCTIDRCYASFVKVSSTTAGINHIYSCYLYKSGSGDVITGYGSTTEGTYYSQLDIQNCVIYSSYSGTYSSNYTSNTIQYLESSVINNNVIYSYTYYYSYISAIGAAIIDVKNSQISNNYICRELSYISSSSSSSRSTSYDYDLSSGVIASGSGNTIEHNILGRSSSLSNYPQNKYNYKERSTVFTCSGSYSGYYRLKDVSPAIGYATDGGDVGCHGGMFGCPAGGRPQYIPYFTKVTVGSRTENGKLPVSVSIKIQDE